ncbi:M15 family metallopeptidase [Paenibacillus sp. SAF-054]|uniref:M15 family metallopeptidase n=1 Tax=unclassified Paenibacillus TaxID=185978 RepID=UPI003F8225E8
MRKYVVTFIVAVLIVGGALWAWDNNRTPASEGETIEKTPALAQRSNPPDDEQPITSDSQISEDDTPTTGQMTGDQDKPGDKGDPVDHNGNAADQAPNNTGASSGENKPDKTEAKPPSSSTSKGGSAVKASSGSQKDSGESKAGSSKTGGKTKFVNTYEVEHVVSNPESMTVLVNKTYRLPAGYVPSDLVYPNVPFTFSEKIDKRKMRREAATALEKLFAGAKKDGVSLAGVSGYRSESRQTTLYNNYVKRDGVKAADTYSARPGHSEHQTGLTIDVSGSTGKCAAESCFAGTKEAKWLDKHAHEYGFIIRYPEGKDSITGYKYEPWHLRYVGTKVAEAVASRSTTLEQYFGSAVPVTK